MKNDRINARSKRPIDANSRVSTKSDRTTRSRSSKIEYSDSLVLISDDASTLGPSIYGEDVAAILENASLDETMYRGHRSTPGVLYEEGCVDRGTDGAGSYVKVQEA